jgi:hypothetical protein
MAEALKLRDLLPDRLDGMGEEARKKLCESEEIGCAKLAWDFIAGQLDEALRSALDCDLFEVFAKVWAQQKVLADCCDPEKTPPGTRSVLEIGEHELKRELHPVVAVTVGSLPCVELSFTLALTAHFSGLKLAVMDAHVTGGSTGEAWASAQLSYAGTPLHGAKESKKVAVPGRFEFAAPGIPIRHPFARH